MSSRELNDTQNFPKYIILRKETDAELHDGAEWQGFIKEVKKFYEKAIKVQTAKLNRQAKQLHTHCENELKTVSEDVSKKLDDLFKVN